MTLFVGVDGGGSHTEAVVADQTLVVRARTRGESGAIGPGRVASAAQAIATTVRAALRRAEATDLPDALVAGVAGAGREAEQRALVEALSELGLARRIEVTTDAAIALESVFHGSAGILLNAGSGSIAYARDPSGVVWRVGGLGWQLGDEGGGYDLGRAALGAIGRASDGRGAATALSRVVTERIGLEALDDLVRWAGGATPSEVAGLAQAVQEAATAGDRTAIEIVDRAALALADHVTALLSRFPSGTGVPIALAGGILTEGWPVRTALGVVLSERHPQVVIAPQPVDPARGALAMAARLRG